MCGKDREFEMHAKTKPAWQQTQKQNRRDRQEPTDRHRTDKQTDRPATGLEPDQAISTAAAKHAAAKIRRIESQDVDAASPRTPVWPGPLMKLMTAADDLQNTLLLDNCYCTVLAQSPPIPTQTTALSSEKGKKKKQKRSEKGLAFPLELQATAECHHSIHPSSQ